MRRTLVISSLWIATMAAAVGGTTAVINAGDASGNVLKPAEVGKQLASANVTSPSKPNPSVGSPVPGSKRVAVRALDPAAFQRGFRIRQEVAGSVYLRCKGNRIDPSTLRVIPARGWNVISAGIGVPLFNGQVVFKKRTTGWVTVVWVQCKAGEVTTPWVNTSG